MALLKHGFLSIGIAARRKTSWRSGGRYFAEPYVAWPEEVAKSIPLGEVFGGIGARITIAREGALYEEVLRGCFVDPDMILADAGQWEADRVAA